MALVAVYILFGILLGTVAHIPVSASLIFGAAIGAWLLVFLVRERLRSRGGGA